MLYSYKDLTQPCYIDSIKQHINSTLKLAKLVSEFSEDLALLLESFSAGLETLAEQYKKKCTECFCSNSKANHVMRKSTLFKLWDSLMQCVSADAESQRNLSRSLQNTVVNRLKSCIQSKHSQVDNMITFRLQIDQMVDTAITTLHKSRVVLRQESHNYEHYRDNYSVAKSKSKETSYDSCVTAHNEYILNLNSYNRMIKEYNAVSLPRTLQELETIEVDSSVAISDSIQSLSILIMDKNRSEVERYEKVVSLCKQVNTSQDISEFVKQEAPQSTTQVHHIQLFTPVLYHTSTPSGLLKARVIHDSRNAFSICEKREVLQTKLSELDKIIDRLENELMVLGNEMLRYSASAQDDGYEIVHQIQEETCNIRNQMSMAKMRQVIIRSQASSLVKPTEDSGRSMSKDHRGGKGSMKAMWKRFAFKALKNSSAGSEPNSSASSGEKQSFEEASHSYSQKSSNNNIDSQPDPVYALLRCAAEISKKQHSTESESKNSSLSLIPQPDDRSFDKSCSSLSSSPPPDSCLKTKVPCIEPSCPCHHPELLEQITRMHLTDYRKLSVQPAAIASHPRKHLWG